MWRCLHTALIIFALALPCFGQDSGVFSNYFATEEMAKWCHSGRVERCQAAGIAVTEPTFWDYLLGKNHAKLENVKTDIKACRPYYVKPVTNVLAVLESEGIAGLTFTNDAHFLTYCGLATNALNETPYFKSQYPSVTGGWQNVRVMITNLVATQARDWYGITNVQTWGEETVIHLWADFDGVGGFNSFTSSVASSGYEDSDFLPLFGGTWSPLPARYSVAYAYDTNYFGYAFSSPAWVGYTNAPTTISKSGEAYVLTVAPYTFYDLPGDTNVWNSQSCAVSNGWAFAGSLSESLLKKDGVKVGIGNTNDLPAMPVFDASMPTNGTVYGLGWQVTNQFVVLNWTTSTNGFKYK